MGKRGPKRQEGRREPNGRLDRGSTVDRLNEMSRRQQEAIMAVVLSQPHRKGKEGNVTDKRLAYAAGRFCRLYRLDNAILDACEEYAAAEHRWLSGWGKPRGTEQHGGGSGAGPTQEQMERWLAKIRKVEAAIRSKFGHDTYTMVRRLIVEDMEQPTSNDAVIRSALCEIAVALEYVKKNPHPFLGV